MAEIPEFTFELLDLQHDPAAAENVLAIAAKCIREGKPLPEDLGRHIASAFEAAVSTPSSGSKSRDKLRNDRLLFALKLKVAHRRLAPISDRAIYIAVEDWRLKKPHWSDEELFQKVAEQLSTDSDHDVGRTTVRNRYKSYAAAILESERIARDEEC